LKTMAVVLAAGQGKRMKSKLYKVLHPVCGKPMVGHIVDMLERVQNDRILVVVGHGADAVKAYLGDRVDYVLQEQQLGTGHAVLQARDLIAEENGTTIVINGDMPLVRDETLMRMLGLHRERGAAATVLTVEIDNPHGLGRVIRDACGEVLRIVEQKDCTEEEARIREINVGTYCFDNRKLFAALAQVTNNNAQQEYYLTDVIEILKKQGETVLAYMSDDASEGYGVNDRLGLAEAERLMRRRINERHMMNGVTIVDPEHTYIEADVRIGPDTVIWPGCLLRGATVIGSGCTIGPQADILDSRIGDNVTVNRSVLLEAAVAEGANIGPFAYLRPGSDIGRNVKIGDFVEIKNASLQEGVKVSHLSYVGDARVGRNVNIGCGAITVNYDGYRKHRTEIGDDAFIGSNVNLIAPVKIGQGAYVVAGSTITRDVPDNDMAIARERQTNKPGYAVELRNRIRARSEAKKDD